MNDDALMTEEVQRLVEFHGHLCPGLLLGYRAAQAAAEALDIGASEDEDVVLIAENDSCAVDAFQAMLSTTFGKGNLFFRDNGKQVFTVGERRSGRAVRVALRFDAFDDGDLDRQQRIERLLSAPADALFNVNPVSIEFPERARIHDTLRCHRCGEGMMSTRSVEADGASYCLPCARDLGLG